MKVRANADTPTDARAARDFGAEGIGLCRTEHMFFDERPHRRGARDDPRRRRDRPPRRARQAPADAARRLRRALHDHGRAAGDDPPARPAAARVPAAHRRRDRRGRDGDAASTPTSCSARADGAARVQPDARPSAAAASAITYPEIDEMQARAILEAALEVGRRRPARRSMPEIMIPLVVTQGASSTSSRRASTPWRRRSSQRDAARASTYQVGTMIELPRAALVADEIAETRRVLLLRHQRPDPDDASASRRDDAGALPRRLYAEGHPRRTTRSSRIDQDGVGELIRIAVERGRADAARHQARHLRRAWRRSGLGRASASEVGLDYVSCSPFRVPIARLAAAQAALGGKVASQA